MSDEVTKTNEMGIGGKIIGIFTSPREAFEAIDQKPNWLVPYILIILAVLVMQYLTLDIQISDQMKMLEARDMTAEQIEAAQSQASGPMKYISFVAIPIFTLIFWAIVAALLFVAANLIVGGESSFKKVFSIVVWSGLVGIIEAAVMTYLILSKGASIGVAMDLSILLPAPAIGESKSLLYRVLQRFDLFTIWSMILWTVGLSVSYKAPVNKTAVPVVVLWLIWIVIAVGFGVLLGDMFGF